MKSKGMKFNSSLKSVLLGKFTLTDFSNKCGIAKGNLSNILNGKSRVSKATIYLIVDTSNKINNKNYSIEYYVEDEE